MGDNHFGGEIPPELGGLVNLISLSLNGNRFSGQVPAELGALPALQRIWLHHNDLTGCLPITLPNSRDAKLPVCQP